MLKPTFPRRLAVTIIALVLAFPAVLQAQNGSSRTLSASVSRLLSVETAGAHWLEEDNLVERAGEAAALTSALADLFQVPVSLSRVSFSVDNALESMDHYKALKYLQPHLYDASRIYRLHFRVIEF